MASPIGAARSSTRWPSRSCWLEAARGGRAARPRPLPDGDEGCPLLDRAGSRDATGALGRKRRLFPVDPGLEHRRPHLRGLLRARARPRGGRIVPRAPRRLPRVPCRAVDRHDRRHAAPRGQATLYSNQPVDPSDADPEEDPNRGVVPNRHRPPGLRTDFPAKEIIDAGFVELVRYGIRGGGDALIEDSLRVVDAKLRVETPFGPCWRRYNHDGYGQRDDGGPFEGWGTGRAWPLLTGERAHYELAAGGGVRPYLRAIEQFASAAGLLPQQPRP